MDTAIKNKPTNEEGGGKPAPNYKVLVIALAAMVVVVAGLIYLKKRKAEKVLGKRSSDEATVLQKGLKTKKAADDQASRTQQSPFGDGLAFDAQGNLQGAKVAPGDLPANRTLGEVEARAQAQSQGTGEGRGGSAADAVEARVDRRALTAANMGADGHGGRSPYSSGGSREPQDPDTMRARREDAVEGRKLVERPTLAFRAGQGYQALQAVNPQSQGTKRPEGADAANDASLNRINTMLDKATGALTGSGGPQAGQGANPAAKLYGGAAEKRAVVTRPGQVADMRTGRGPDFQVDEGKFLDAIVVNQVEASWNDSPLVAMVARDLVSRDGEYVLVPRGSKVLCVAERVGVMDQERVLLKAHRVIFPDRSSAWFPERTMPEGMAADGSLGVPGKVNRHFWRQFGAAIVLGVVEGYAAYQSGPSTISPLGIQELSPGQAAVTATSKQFSEVAKRIMDKYSNVGPTISLKPGSRLKFYFGEDTFLSGYAPVGAQSYVREGAH